MGALAAGAAFGAAGCTHRESVPEIRDRLAEASVSVRSAIAPESARWTSEFQTWPTPECGQGTTSTHLVSTALVARGGQDGPAALDDIRRAVDRLGWSKVAVETDVLSAPKPGVVRGVGPGEGDLHDLEVFVQVTAAARRHWDLVVVVNTDCDAGR